MKINKLYIYILLVISGCKGSERIYHMQIYYKSPYGAHIELIHKTDFDIKGELIAVDTNAFIILEDNTGVCKKVEFSSLSGYNIIYARDDRYAFTIPLFAVMTYMHGALLVYSLPLNLITTTSVALTNKSPYTIEEFDNIPGEAYKYARFPQGLPEGLDLKSLENLTEINR